jgi:hypothetical protein
VPNGIAASRPISGAEAWVIRQTISCDICKSEKKQSNHWFVAYEQGAELRLGGWNSRYRTRPGAKHLCGQACVYRLMDDFMARLIAAKPQAEIEGPTPTPARPRAAADTSLTSSAAYIEVESVRLISPSAKAELVAMPGKAEGAVQIAALEESPRYATRDWRAGAWERELEREQREQHEQREIEIRPDLLARRGF